MIRKFGLGAAPEHWTSLTDHLLASGYTLGELSSVGLTVVKDPDTPGGKKRYFDMFRNRAIFPIIDMYRNVIAFGGRSLGKEQPKYMNTSDTPVFNKRKNIYAANLLRQQRHLPHVILVEGYMDVVSLSQFGVEGVCATLGTALTRRGFFAVLRRKYGWGMMAIPPGSMPFSGDSTSWNRKVFRHGYWIFLTDLIRMSLSGATERTVSHLFPPFRRLFIVFAA